MRARVLRIVPDQPQYLFFQASGCNAIGYQTPDGLTVIAGSKGSPHVHRGAPPSIGRRRDELRAQGVVEINEHELVFLKDYAFATPTAAAGVLVGSAVNGPRYWRNENGQSINDLAADNPVPTRPKHERMRKTAGARKVMDSLAISINSYSSILDDTHPGEVDLDKHRADIVDIISGMGKIGNFLKMVTEQDN